MMNSVAELSFGTDQLMLVIPHTVVSGRLSCALTLTLKLFGSIGKSIFEYDELVSVSHCQETFYDLFCR